MVITSTVEFESTEIVSEQLLNLVQLDASILSGFTLVLESFVDINYEICQTLHLYVIFVLKLFDHFMHLDTIFSEKGFVDLF